jgi:hypothetical protein
MNTPFNIGTRFIETLWYAFANRIIDKAIQVYNVDQEKADELRKKFLKRGEYRVESLNTIGLSE